MSAWLRSGPPSVTAQDVAGRLGDPSPPLILDVRTPQEFASGHIRGARSVPLPDLPAALDRLPQDREIVCVCASGSRSKRASSMIGKRGLLVLNLKGGMGAWVRAGLPVQRGGGNAPAGRRRRKR
jgi:phage shock protein E